MRGILPMFRFSTELSIQLTLINNVEIVISKHSNSAHICFYFYVSLTTNLTVCFIVCRLQDVSRRSKGEWSGRIGVIWRASTSQYAEELHADVALKIFCSKLNEADLSGHGADNDGRD